MEWYDEWEQRRSQAANEKNSTYYASPSSEYITPFKIADEHFSM